MKFNYAKFFLTVALLAMNFAVFAQFPDPNNDGEDGDGPGSGDPEATPINTKLIYLAIMAVAFAYYQIRVVRKKAHQ